MTSGSSRTQRPQVRQGRALAESIRRHNAWRSYDHSGRNWSYSAKLASSSSRQGLLTIAHRLIGGLVTGQPSPGRDGWTTSGSQLSLTGLARGLRFPAMNGWAITNRP